MHRGSKVGQILCCILQEFHSGQRRYLPSMIGRHTAAARAISRCRRSPSPCNSPASA